MKSFNPLHHKLPELQKSEEVGDAVEKHKRLTGERVSNTPDAKLTLYMDRLENVFLNDNETTRKRNIEMLRDNIYDAFIIKHDDVPESYFDIQKRVARERGQQVEEIPEETKEQMIQVIIEDQKKSLSAWVDYLSSNDAMYPAWFKYFVFRNITKLSQFDKELGKFKERTKATTAPFPDIYREALATMSDLYESASRDKELFKDQDFQTFLSQKFPTQYANAIQKTLEHSQEDREQIRGIWVKYKQGDKEGAQKLYKSLENKGTGWCTAGHSTAQAQIKSGDFYVFYSNDKDNTPSNPRLAIRMEEDHIGEVRGILQHQEVEPLLQEALDEKLATFGQEADKYKKKSADMKRLTAIEKVTNENKQLTREDLRFLYEVDITIEGFGYGKDPRIKELQQKRNRMEDLATICNSSLEHIAMEFTRINEHTQVFCEDTREKVTIVDFREEKNRDKLPKLLELAQVIKATGSPARPDMSFEGGIIPVNIPYAKVQDLPTALQSYKEADNSSSSYVWDEWKNAKETPIASSQFEAVILSYNKDTRTRVSSEKIVEDMDKLGLRPATLEEMIALGIAKPEHNKRGDVYLVGLTQYSLVGSSCVPRLFWDGERRGLGGDWWGFEWDDWSRFVCVRK